LAIAEDEAIKVRSATREQVGNFIVWMDYSMEKAQEIMFLYEFSFGVLFRVAD
jgi:hypothetical protein